MKPDGFTRRSFIRLSTATIMGTALGMTSTTLVGCSDDSSSNTDASASQSIDTQDAIKLHVSDRSFSVDEGPEVAMSTDILSLIPVVASNTIEAAYVDENGEWQREPLGDLGSAIVVHGTLGMLTADGTKGEGSVIVADDADISVLSIGTIERADVEGKVGCLVVLGPADATAQSGASLDHVVVNSHTGIIEKVENATVGSIHAPKGTDATGEVIESVLQPITAEDEFALTVNGSCLASYGDSSNENDNEWRANFGEDTTSESSQSNDKSASASSFIGSLFAPKTAYADEAEGELQPLDDNSDDADSDADATDNSDPDTDDTNDDTSSDNQDSKPGDPNDPPVDVEHVEPDDPNAEYTPEEGAVEGDSSDYNPSSDDPDAGIPDDAAVPIPYPGLERVDPEAAGANIGEEIAIKLLGKALKGVAKWAGEEIADYAGDKVLDLIFGEVFGDETAEELEKIEAKLDEIDGKLDEIEKGIAQIISQLQKMTYAGQVDTYISTFYTPIKTWIQGIESAAQKYVDDMDKDKRLDAAKEFAEIILTNSDYNYETGTYYTHIYAYDGEGNRGFAATEPIELSLPSGTAVADGRYTLRAAIDTGKALDVSGARTEDNANVNIWSWNGGLCQQFDVTKRPDGFYQITAGHSGKAVEIGAALRDVGANVSQYQINNHPAQQWHIQKNSDSTYSLRNRQSGLYLDIAGAATNDGANVNQYTGNGSAAQKWFFVPIDASKWSVSAIKAQAYTGKAIKPKLTVKAGGVTLKAGTDYTASYKNNVKLGTATVTVTGKNGFTETTRATFKIVRAKVSVPKATNRPYTGKTQVGVAAGTGYKLGGTTKAKKAGTYTATATPDANHCWPDGKTDTRKLTWKIVAPSERYRTHVQSHGNQAWRTNGQASGTFGESKRLEGIWIELPSKPVSGSIRYRTHVQSYGDQPWVTEGKMSGTSGESKRLESIQIELTGKMATTYDVWYRVHAQTFGWMGWAKNGARSGTAGYSKRLEAIQIVILPKGSKAPAASYGGYAQATSQPFRRK